MIIFVKSSLGVNFTNVLRAAFTHANPKSAKKLLNLTVFFALLGSEQIKAAHRMLVKLTLVHLCKKVAAFHSRVVSVKAGIDTFAQPGDSHQDKKLGIEASLK